jgi:hypothetical protein
MITANIAFFLMHVYFQILSKNPRLEKDIGAENWQISTVSVREQAGSIPVWKRQQHICCVAEIHYKIGWRAGAPRYQALAGSNKFLIAGEHQGLCACINARQQAAEAAATSEETCSLARRHRRFLCYLAFHVCNFIFAITRALSAAGWWWVRAPSQPRALVASLWSCWRARAPHPSLSYQSTDAALHHFPFPSGFISPSFACFAPRWVSEAYTDYP